MSLIDLGTFVPEHPNLLRLSTHSASQSAVAERVVQHAGAVPLC